MMAYPSDIEIAQSAKLLHIGEIAKKAWNFGRADLPFFSFMWLRL